jgi:hypothetical protein
MSATRAPTEAQARSLARAQAQAESMARRVGDLRAAMTKAAPATAKQAESLDKAKAAHEAAAQKVEALRAAIVSTAGPSREQARAFERARQTARQAKTAFESHAVALERTRRAASAAGVNLRNLAGEGRRVGDAYQQATARMRAFNAAAEHKRSQPGEGASVVDGLGSAASFYAVGRAMGATNAAVGDLEHGLAQFRTITGASAAEAAALKTQLVGLARVTNQPVGELLGATHTMTGMGMPGDIVSQSIESVGRTATATGAAMEAMARSTFSIWQSMGIAPERLQRALDGVNQTTKDGGVEFKDLASILPGLTARMGVLGFTGEKGLASLGAMIQTVRLNSASPEEAENRLSNLLEGLQNDTVRKGFEERGVDLRGLMRRAAARGQDPVAAAVNAAKRLTGGNLDELGDLGFDMQARQAMVALLQHEKRKREIEQNALAAMRRPAGQKGVTDEDFAIIRPALKEDLKALGIEFNLFKVAIGDALQPIIQPVIVGLTSILGGATKLISAFPNLAATVAVVGGGFYMVSRALAVVRLAKAITGFSTLQSILAPIGRILVPLATAAFPILGRALGGLGGAAGTAAAGVGTVGGAAASAAVGTAAAGAAAGAAASKTSLLGRVLAPVGRAFAFLGARALPLFLSPLATATGVIGGLAAVFSPLGAALAVGAGLGLAGVAVYKNWNNIKTLFSDIGSVVGNVGRFLGRWGTTLLGVVGLREPLGAVFGPMVDGARAAFKIISDGLDQVGAKLRAWNEESARAREAAHAAIRGEPTASDRTGDGLAARAKERARREGRERVGPRGANVIEPKLWGSGMEPGPARRAANDLPPEPQAHPPAPQVGETQRPAPPVVREGWRGPLSNLGPLRPIGPAARPAPSWSLPPVPPGASPEQRLRIVQQWMREQSQASQIVVPRGQTPRGVLSAQPAAPIPLPPPAPPVPMVPPQQDALVGALDILALGATRAGDAVGAMAEAFGALDTRARASAPLPAPAATVPGAALAAPAAFRPVFQPTIGIHLAAPPAAPGPAGPPGPAGEGVAGARVRGGPVSAGLPYLVGERGPEIVVPGQSGTVIPNHAIGGAPASWLAATRATFQPRVEVDAGIPSVAQQPATAAPAAAGAGVSGAAPITFAPLFQPAFRPVFQPTITVHVMAPGGATAPAAMETVPPAQDIRLGVVAVSASAPMAPNVRLPAVSQPAAPITVGSLASERASVGQIAETMRRSGDPGEAAASIENLLAHLARPETARQFGERGIDTRREMAATVAVADPFERAALVVSRILKAAEAAGVDAVRQLNDVQAARTLREVSVARQQPAAPALGAAIAVPPGDTAASVPAPTIGATLMPRPAPVAPAAGPAQAPTPALLEQPAARPTASAPAIGETAAPIIVASAPTTTPVVRATFQPMIDVAVTVPPMVQAPEPRAPEIGVSVAAPSAPPPAAVPVFAPVYRPVFQPAIHVHMSPPVVALGSGVAGGSPASQTSGQPPSAAVAPGPAPAFAPIAPPPQGDRPLAIGTTLAAVPAPVAAPPPPVMGTLSATVMPGPAPSAAASTLAAQAPADAPRTPAPTPDLSLPAGLRIGSAAVPAPQPAPTSTAMPLIEPVIGATVVQDTRSAPAPLVAPAPMVNVATPGAAIAPPVSVSVPTPPIAPPVIGGAVVNVPPVAVPAPTVTVPPMAAPLPTAPTGASTQPALSLPPLTPGMSPQERLRATQGWVRSRSATQQQSGGSNVIPMPGRGLGGAWRQSAAGIPGAPASSMPRLGSTLPDASALRAGEDPAANPRAQEAMRFFQERGWSKEQSAGLVGNLIAESNLSTTAVGDGGKARGIAQWHPDRQANFRQFAGKDIGAADRPPSSGPR